MKSTDEWVPLCFGDRKGCILRSQESFSELLNDDKSAAIVFLHFIMKWFTGSAVVSKALILKFVQI